MGAGIPLSEVTLYWSQGKQKARAMIARAESENEGSKV
jgi:hypothetical protein